jgi:hypothetical protein
MKASVRRRSGQATPSPADVMPTLIETRHRLVYPTHHRRQRLRRKVARCSSGIRAGLMAVELLTDDVFMSMPPMPF